MSFSISEAAPHHILLECISVECAVPGLNATFCFLWFTNCVLLSDKYSNTRMLVNVGICFKQHF